MKKLLGFFCTVLALSACDLQPKIASIPDSVGEFISNRYPALLADPEKQPEMWLSERFEQIFEHCNAGAILTTYCAKGIVRRAMQAAGFAVERLQGPPGKREMLRSRKSD